MALLARHAALLPADLVAADPAVLLEPQGVSDLNEAVDQALQALPSSPEAGTALAIPFLDPAIAPVAGSRDGLGLLAAALILEEALGSPLDEDFEPAIEVTTAQVGDRVCLEVARGGMDVGGCAWRMDDLAQLLAAELGAELTSSIGNAEMRCALRLPALAWAPVGGTVLVLDDEPTVREVICRILCHAGMAARALASAEELEALLGRERPGLLLIEASVADPERGPVIEWLARSRPALAPRTVVLTTAPAGEQTRAALAALRRGWYLAKPFTGPALVALARRRLMCLPPPAGDPPSAAFRPEPSFY